MAELGLFSDPRQLQEALLMQQAKMTPQETINYMALKGGRGLGEAVGGMFGVNVQDPAVAAATKLRELGAKYGTTTAEALDKIAADLQATYPQLAMQVAEKANQLRLTSGKIKAEEALTAQRTAAANKETQLATPADIVKAQRIAALKAAIPQYEASGDDITAKRLKDELEVLTAGKKPTINYGAEADRAAVANFGVPFNELTQQQAKVIDDLLETRGLKKAQAGKTVVDLSGLKDAGDITGLRKDLQAITKPYQDQSDAAGDAISLADMAIKQNNFAAVASLSRSLAKAAGETQLSGRDVEAFGIDPSLVGRVADTVSRLSQSRPTVDTLTKLRQLAEALKKKADSRIAIEEEQLQATARASKRFTEEQINTVFRRRPAETTANKTEFKSVAEAEAAKLPKGTIITINGRKAIVE